MEFKEKYPNIHHFEASAITSEGIDEFLKHLIRIPNFEEVKEPKSMGVKILPKSERKYRDYRKCC